MTVRPNLYSWKFAAPIFLTPPAATDWYIVVVLCWVNASRRYAVISLLSTFCPVHYTCIFNQSLFTVDASVSLGFQFGNHHLLACSFCFSLCLQSFPSKLWQPHHHSVVFILLLAIIQKATFFLTFFACVDINLWVVISVLISFSYIISFV